MATVLFGLVGVIFSLHIASEKEAIKSQKEWNANQLGINQQVFSKLEALDTKTDQHAIDIAVIKALKDVETKQK